MGDHAQIYSFPDTKHRYGSKSLYPSGQYPNLRSDLEGAKPNI